MLFKSSLAKLFSVLAVSGLLLSGCQTEMGSSVYTSSATTGKVLEGVVVSARPITIKPNASLQQNTGGMLAGGLLGGIAASGVGSGSGNTAAIAGAALAGAALGTLVQDKLGKSNGMEYVVRLDPRYVKKNKPVNVTRTEISYSEGNGSVQSQINDSMEISETQTDLLSVVQGMDTVFQAGQRVLIIYNDDRPRLAPAGY